MDPFTAQPASTPTSALATANAPSSSSLAQAMNDPRYAAYVPAPVVGSSITVTNTNSPFYIKSNNGPNYKYKYPEAQPTPDGEDDVQWGKIYTAADSRKYNHHGKSSTESKKFRQSGETTKLALEMLIQNKEKYGMAVQMAIAAGAPIPTDIPRATPKPGSTPAKSTPKTEPRPKKEIPDMLGGSGGEVLSISEKIKSQARVRTPSTLSMSPSTFNQTASPLQQELGSSKKNSPAPRPAKPDKVIPAKRSSDMPAKPSKKSKMDESTASVAADLTTTQSPTVPKGAPGSLNMWAINDGGYNPDNKKQKVHCFCRRPDDNTTMVQCNACDEWFHGSCLSLTKHDAETLLDTYYCTKCTTPASQTKFRKLCRLNELYQKERKRFKGMECRMPARVDQGSKYCSEEHGHEFMRYIVLNCLRISIDEARGGSLNVAEFANMIKAVTDYESLQRLGQKPILVRRPDSDPSLPVGAGYVTEYEVNLIMALKSQKSSSQSRFDLFTKMQLFLKMVDKRARLAAEYLGVNPTSICGYDNRLSMNEVQFKKYLETPEAKAAFETGCLGEPTPDSKAFTDTITNDQILPVLGCEVPEPLRNVCCAQWFHSHKSKKNCQHNTVGGIWWREKYADEYNRIKYICTLELATLDKYINENYETAEEREILRPYYAHNITEKVRESIASD